VLLINGNTNLTREEKENCFKKKNFNKQREEKYKINNYTKPSSKRRTFFRKVAYYPIQKNNCKFWACREIRHYVNECKHRKNNKLIETLSNILRLVKKKH